MKSLLQRFKNFWVGFIQFWSYFFLVLKAFKPYGKKVVQFISNWNEIITIPIGVAVFFFTPMLLRMLDPTSASYDLGVLHSIIFAIAAMLIIHGFAFVLLKISFPSVYKFIDEVFEEHFYQRQINDFNLSTYQKCVLSLFLFAIYLFGTILLVSKIF